MTKKPNIEGLIKKTSFYGFTVYEYFELSKVHGRIFVSEVCYNALPSETYDDGHSTRIRKSCETDSTKISDMSLVEYLEPAIKSDKEGSK